MALRTNGNITGKLSSSTSNLSGNLSNAVIQSGGTTDYNELENLPDLSVYALTKVTYEKEHEAHTYQYRQDEYAKLIGSIDTKAEYAKVSAQMAFDITAELNANKADKEHNHDNYATTNVITSDSIHPIELGQEEFAKFIGGQSDMIASLTETINAVSEGVIDNSDRLFILEDEVLPNKADKEHTHEQYAVKKTIEYKDTTPEQLEISENTSVIKMNIQQDTTIVLPANLGSSDAKEITLFLNILEEAVVSFDNVALWQNEPVLEAGTVCELIFTWSGSEWLGGCIVYGKQL